MALLLTGVFASGMGRNSAVPYMVLLVTIGAGIWLLFSIDLITALLFEALISATDPVAVIPLFKELGAP